jgi:anaphase-promoting complex subunit 1
MAINMALALLFLGGGKYSLKTDSLSIALMLCAFYPHFPVESNDNRFRNTLYF